MKSTFQTRVTAVGSFVTVSSRSSISSLSGPAGRTDEILSASGFFLAGLTSSRWSHSRSTSGCDAFVTSSRKTRIASESRVTLSGFSIGLCSVV